MLVFGIQQLAYGTFARWVAKTPAWLPIPQIWPYATGIAFVVCATAILLRKDARRASLFLSAMILAMAVLLHPFEIAANPGVLDLWARACKVVALSGAAALVAGSLRKERGVPWLEWLIPLGPFFLAAFLLIGGIEHFHYARFVVQMIPAWIPAHTFFTYFTGTALLAGGIGILIPRVSRLAGTLVGLMIFSWVLLLHIPKALSDLHKVAETTAIFEALALSGAAFLAAGRKNKNADAKTD
jgi:uncharacterized membrane protein